MTNSELVDALVTNLLKEGNDPHFVIGYLSSQLSMVIDNAPKKYKTECRASLTWHLDRHSA